MDGLSRWRHSPDAAPQPTAARRNLGRGRQSRRRSRGFRTVDRFHHGRRASPAHDSRARRAARASPDAARRSRRAVHDSGAHQTAPSCRAPSGTGETRALFEGVGARFVGSGHIVFGRQGNSGQSASIRTPSRRLELLAWCATTSSGRRRLSAVCGGRRPAGLRAHQSGLGHARQQGPDAGGPPGRRERLPFEARVFRVPRLSPTGDRLVVQIGAEPGPLDL